MPTFSDGAFQSPFQIHLTFRLRCVSEKWDREAAFVDISLPNRLWSDFEFGNTACCHRLQKGQSKTYSRLLQQMIFPNKNVDLDLESFFQILVVPKVCGDEERGGEKSWWKIANTWSRVSYGLMPYGPCSQNRCRCELSWKIQNICHGHHCPPAVRIHDWFVFLKYPLHRSTLILNLNMFWCTASTWASRTLPMSHEVSFQLTSFRIHSDDINPRKITIRISDENFTVPQICGRLLAHLII